MRNSKSALRKAAVWLTAVLIICMSLPLAVSAKGGERKKVRAGWHEPPHFMTDVNGRKTGYSYEYQRKIAAYVQRLQERVNKEDKFEYAMAVFDCNYLKKINDLHGHDKGDIYLKNACRLICNVFEHSPVFRIGGDEFAAVLMNDDLKNREKLILLFEEKQTEKNSGTEDEWEQIHVAYGIAVYDPSVDGSVEDTIRRADRAMYEYKAESKARDEKKEDQ